MIACTLLAGMFWAGAAAAAPATRPGESPVAPRPALWLLADEDTRIYLFGTVHILPPNLVWRSAALDRVVAEADELVLETDDDEAEQASAGIVAALRLGKDVPLEWRVAPHRREALREMVAASGMPMEDLAGLHTWAVAMTLAMAEIARAYQPEEGPDAAMASLSGVEDVLTAEFRARGLPISGVESGEQQLGFFSRLSFRLQRQMLEEMIDAYASGATLAAPDDTAWLTGDVEAIARDMEQMPPELRDVLLDRRNRAWTSWLIERLDRPGTLLFAVGAGHLAGPGSVQSMLAERGYRVARLD